MPKRYVAIWFRFLSTDWFTIRKPHLGSAPFVLAAPQHGRMVITWANAPALKQGIHVGMAVADARAIFPALEVLDDKPALAAKAIKGLAAWCIRYTPVVAIDPPCGLILDVTGCAHLWGGERTYLKEIVSRLKSLGYDVRAAIADTIGAAWAMSRFGAVSIVEKGCQAEALLSLPPVALRLEPGVVERLQKLGLQQIRSIINMPRSALRRRFGQELINRLDQALGVEDKAIDPLQPVEPFQERLPCLEPIVTAKGIEIALKRLLETLCHRLKQEQKGLRQAILKGYRVDGKIEQIEIGTHSASNNKDHLFKLFELKLETIEPSLGIEVFVLEAPRVEDVSPKQDKLWESIGGLEDSRLSELIDRFVNKTGAPHIHRYLPDEHHWPERSVKRATSLHEKAGIPWKVDPPRPMQLLHQPEPVTVAAPVPDYPPMLFRYKGRVHTIKKADGPERIEREWWLDEGQHRDYYTVEDEEGRRYWLFRSGHYDAEKTYQWFIHGFFA